MLCDLCKEIGNHLDEIFGLGTKGGNLAANAAKRQLSTDEAESSAMEEESPSNEERSSPRSFDLPKPEPNGHMRKKHQEFEHHKSYTALAESACSGCSLCAAVVRENERQLNPTSGKNDTLLENCQIFVRSTSEYAALWFQQGGLNRKASDLNVWLSMFTTESDATAIRGLIRPRPISRTLLSESTREIVSQWIHECHKSHPACGLGHAKSLPTRVIDVGSKIPKLIVSGGSLGNWVALSHCWGGNIATSTTTKNLTARLSKLVTRHLPKNFQDAISVTRWENESSKMVDVYKHASITIAAEYAADAQKGFLRRRTTDDEAIQISYRSYSQCISGTFFVRPYSDIEDNSHPLASRGWALQEFVLSPRTLHFGQKQLHWTCQTSCYGEGDPSHSRFLGTERMYLKRFFLNPSEIGDSLDSDFTHDPILRWYKILANYCTRRLTTDGDQLPAISGIARETHRLTGLTYQAGIWREDMHRGLLWACGGRSSRNYYSTVPSWSWASQRLDRPFAATTEWTNLRDLETKDPRFSAHIEACHIHLASHDGYGKTLSGQLIIHGLCQRVSALRSRSPLLFWDDTDLGYWYLQSSHNDTHHVPFTSKHTLCEIDDLHMRYDKYLDPNSSLPGKRKFKRTLQQSTLEDLQIPIDTIYLQVAKWSSIIDPRGTLYALILEPTEQPSCYRRIGRAQIPTCDRIAETGWKLETVTII